MHKTACRDPATCKVTGTGGQHLSQRAHSPMRKQGLKKKKFHAQGRDRACSCGKQPGAELDHRHPSGPDCRPCGQPRSQSLKQGTAPQERTALTTCELCCRKAMCHGEEEVSSYLCYDLLHPHPDHSRRQDNIYLHLVSAEEHHRERKQQEER